MKISPALAAISAVGLMAMTLTAAHAVSPTGLESEQPRIIGGGYAQEPLSWLGYDYCGYSLIAPRWMITAAHCLKPYKFRINSLEHKQGGEMVEMANIIRHPKYVRGSNDKGYDVALIELTKPATSRPSVIAAGAGPVGQKTRIWGWGATTQTGEDSSDRLKVLDTSLIAGEECKQKTDEFFNLSLDLCISNAGNTGACYGDSGGPMTKLVNGQLQIVGVTSRGPEKCGTAPSIYTNITMHADWIKQVTRGEALFAGGDTTQPGAGATPAPGPTQPAPPVPTPTRPPAPTPTRPPAPTPTRPPTPSYPVPSVTPPPGPTGQPTSTGQPTRPRPTWPGMPGMPGQP